MTVEYKEHPEQKMVEIVLDGKVTEADVDGLAPKMEAFMEQHGKVKILEIVKSFGGFEPSMLVKGTNFDLKNLKHYSCAVVSDSGWIGPVARLMSSMLSMEVRVFKLDEEQQAREWLKTA